MPRTPRPPVNLERIMRLLKGVDEKLDVALSGHGERIKKLEASDADKESRLSQLEFRMRWVVRKLGDE